MSPGVGVTSEVYREQAQKIEELEKENKRLASEVEENERRWKKGEEELEELRESRGDAALAVEKGKEADALVGAHAVYNFLRAILTYHTENGSRIAQETAFSSTITKQQIHTPYSDSIAKPKRID